MALIVIAKEEKESDLNVTDYPYKNCRAAVVQEEK